jgi:carboxylate-amine ligase
MVLPVIPALAASTPFFDGKYAGFHDSRMEAYRHNQAKIPSIAGVIIPEAVFSSEAYRQRIFNPILHDIRPFDEEKILDKHFLNSRGAIARFDRGAIEIRVIDIQESPLADMAIVNAVTGLIKLVAKGLFGSYEEQKQWHEVTLASIFLGAIKNSGMTVIEDSLYLKFWGCKKSRLTAGELWLHLAPFLKTVMLPEYFDVFSVIVNQGTLSQRLLAAVGKNFSKEDLVHVYRRLVQCLSENRLFLP